MDSFDEKRYRNDADVDGDADLMGCPDERDSDGMSNQA